MALLLPAKRGDERLKVARDMRKLYDYRSGLVHGSLPVTAHSSAELYKAANEAEGLAVRTAKEFWTRGQVARWKNNDEIRDWFERRKYRIGVK
jgi:ferritin-like protein